MQFPVITKRVGGKLHGGREEDGVGEEVVGDLGDLEGDRLEVEVLEEAGKKLKMKN